MTGVRLIPLLTLALLMSFVGCLVGPDYERPPTDAPPAWRLGGNEASVLANTAWWEQFQDEELSRLVRTALEHNLDLRVAIANVEQVAARVGIARSVLFPQLGGGAAVSRSRNSETLDLSLPGAPRTSNYFEGLFGLTWEVDLWGRIRRNVESANASLATREEARRGVVLTIVTSVAATYVQLLGFDAQLNVSRHTVGIREKALDIQNQKFKGGEIAEHDFRRAEAELAVARQSVAALEAQVAQTENALSVLLGHAPMSISRGKDLRALTLPTVIPAGLPSDLLERRPDIRAAEQQIIAANAQIGVAKAEYFPRISLTGFLGLQSNDFDDLWDAQSRAWQFGPQLAQPIFTAGRLGSQVEEAEAAKEQALYFYQRTIINAFREFEDALIGFRKLGEQEEQLGVQVHSLERYFDLSQQRYNEGYADYLEVLDAQRNLFNAQLGYHDIRAQHFIQLITLYSAMGGGWVVDADNTVLQSRAQTALK